jgi:hypothetical protein
VCGSESPDAVGEHEDEEEEICGVGGEATRAATVREAAVPLCTEQRCILRRELRSPLGVRVGRTTLSIFVVAVEFQLQLARQTPTESGPSVAGASWFLQVLHGAVISIRCVVLA